MGKGSVSLEDIDAADLIFVVGQNPGTNHPRMLTALEAAKRNGARIVTVNPLPEPGLMRFKNPQTVRGLIGRGTELSDLFLQLRVNGDLALFKALNRLILDADAVDRDFVESHCDGFDELRRDLEALSWPDVEYATGLARAEIERAAALAAESKGIVVCWAMGLTQHRNAVATIREIANFLLLRGNIGRRGAGLCPVRGHSNVQGDRTMGISDRPTAAFLDRLSEAFDFEPPREPGFDVVKSIQAMRAGRAHVFMALGGNFLRAAPDTARHGGRIARHAADGPRVHQAEPLAPGDGRPGADPSDARAQRARRAGLGGAGRLRRGLDEDRARLARAAEPRLGRAALGGRDRVRPRPPRARRHPADPVGGVRVRLFAHPRADRRGRARVSSASRNGSRRVRASARA